MKKTVFYYIYTTSKCREKKFANLQTLNKHKFLIKKVTKWLISHKHSLKALEELFRNKEILYKSPSVVLQVAPISNK